MSAPHTETEALILEAARKVFLDNGFDGTSMQMISDEAGINKALLHYYFRSKDRLFEAIFIEAFSRMIPDLIKVFASEAEFPEKIRSFVKIYISALQQYPQIPLFILHELHRNPGRIIELIRSTGMNPDLVIQIIRKETEKGKIIDIDPYQLMVNMLAMCIFPFAARPMIQGFIFKNDAKTFELFLEKRKTEVADFIIKAITPC
ncbi:MAG: TetR/AcrR family transcriptional regulator [Bacteroidales bacterium]|jgi:AcrR family transcriptional regulator|nr:TetR/AcrR family transcriptional regulator [Bacteroidales bacterium]